ncbi:MAG: Gfo/Idh/MocA family oxidoreductase [Planctomycetaceae bacterium]|nr:Gfo/Idh/MocA family oxidoreductase [Planctomycetaceae bacterium]
MNRREFTKTTALGFGAGLTLLNGTASVFGAAANEKINLGFIGCGGRGRQLLGDFVLRNDVSVLHCCDSFRQRAEAAAGVVEGSELITKPTLSTDMRTVLDDPKVDAVVCALPDHWHALACILACQSGKDVYTEKPASHSAWEGQKMVEAARKYKCIVQHGTQCRSAPYCIAAQKYIANGKLGKIHYVRVYNMKEWTNFTLAPATAVPEGVDWDRWLGPAPSRPFSPSYPSVWHHLWDFSSGDMINDGIHQLDLARMLIGKELPKSAYCVGGRFNSQGSAETPDTQIATWEFDDLVMTFELTLYTPYMLKIDPEVRNNDMFPYWLQCATRIEIYGSEGLMMMGRHGGGWEVFVRTKNREPVVTDSMYGRFPDPEHKENFLACVRSRELPNGDIEIGHRSTLLTHYATISYRLGGQKLVIDPKTETIPDNPEAMKLFKREYRKPYEVPENV